jgi:hypothetical protein
MMNIGKTVAVSNHTKQSRFLMRPKITYGNTDIAYKPDAKFFGIRFIENLKWTTHIRILRLQLSKVCYIIKSVQGIIGLGMIRSFYHSKFESLVRYGIIFWGADNEILPIFKLQKRVIQSMCGAGTHTFCRQLFKDCKILTVTSLYVFELLCFLKKYKSAVQKKINKYMILIHGQICIYTSNLVIQIYKKCN